MLEQLERQETQQQLTVPRLEVATPLPVAENDQRQRRRMVIALAMLLVALALVLVKDRDFWFPATDVADSEAVDDSAPGDAANPAVPADASATPTLPASRKRARPAPVASSRSVVPEAAASPIVTVPRAALPPLRIEVVAGDRRQMVKPGNPSVAVELQNGASSRASSEPASAGTELASGGNTPVINAGLTRTVRPEYPMLARQMKVQGAVVLDAQIGKDGGVQTLQVVGGPAILADAAREAVKQWRFKPYFQNGQPVETQVPITVNFTIQTH
ncbi:MAG: TonB family protein [Terriglobales bacterium]